MMNPTPKRKGIIDATVGSHAKKGSGAFNMEPLKQEPPPIKPYNQCDTIRQNASDYGEPLQVTPLTVAKPGEPVVCTPQEILTHPAYKGGWKVLQHFRPDGRSYLTFIHEVHGRFRSKKQVLIHLDNLMIKEEESSDQSKHGCGANQQAQGMSAASASPLAEGKCSAVQGQ